LINLCSLGGVSAGRGPAEGAEWIGYFITTPNRCSLIAHESTRSYGIRRLGSLDAIHLATADPFLTELTDFVTNGNELALAATELGFPVTTPS